jgi:hypothetical protein
VLIGLEESARLLPACIIQVGINASPLNDTLQVEIGFAVSDKVNVHKIRLREVRNNL